MNDCDWTPARIRALRKRRGETQDEFAKHFKLSVGAVQNWEQGKQVPIGPAQVILDQLEVNTPQAELVA